MQPATLALLALLQFGPRAEPAEALTFDALIHDARARRTLLVNGYAQPEQPDEVRLWSWSGARFEHLPSGGPPARTLSAAAFDSRRGRLVLFGGLGKAGLADPRSDTWEWDGERWHAAGGAGAGARDHHELAFDEARGRVVLFGGVATRGEGAERVRVHPTDTWTWDGASWTRAAEEGPPARAGAPLAYDAEREEVVLFGGVDPEARRLGDTWAWDGAAWSPMAEEGPRARNGHALAYDARAEVVLLFGGTTGGEHLADLWRWDGREWSEVELAGERPGPRVGAGLAHDVERGVTLLYGGRVRAADGRVADCGEAWEWDGERWTRRL